jgi:hypothetical protein
MRWDIPLCPSVWLNDRWDGNAPEREYSTGMSSLLVPKNLSYRIVPSLRRLSPSPARLLPPRRFIAPTAASSSPAPVAAPMPPMRPLPRTRRRYGSVPSFFNHIMSSIPSFFIPRTIQITRMPLSL